ncbi:hypothetical protein P692DRAFT_20597885 [Suillus brevipes Sb2]|nr:hypothetical protein P692DRAFT_20597885 [Suillus brevipes Sb2]
MIAQPYNSATGVTTIQQTNRNHSGFRHLLRADPLLTLASGHQMVYQAIRALRKRPFRAITTAYCAGKVRVVHVHATDIDRLGSGLGLKALVSNFLPYGHLPQPMANVAVLAMKLNLRLPRSLRPHHRCLPSFSRLQILLLSPVLRLQSMRKLQFHQCLQQHWLRRLLLRRR